MKPKAQAGPKPFSLGVWMAIENRIWTAREQAQKQSIQMNLRKQLHDPLLMLKSVGSCIGGKISGNRTQRHDSDTQWRDKKKRNRITLKSIFHEEQGTNYYNTYTTMSRKSTTTSMWSRKRTWEAPLPAEMSKETAVFLLFLQLSNAL